jgi:hypothetical protein
MVLVHRHETLIFNTTKILKKKKSEREKKEKRKKEKRKEEIIKERTVTQLINKNWEKDGE